MIGSTEQELSRSEAQVSAQDGRLEDGSDMGREEVRPNSRATSMDVDHDVNWEDTGLTNAHGRGEDASADQGDKGCDYLQMERVNQISEVEREERQGISGQGEANPQLCGSTEQELQGSEAQVSAQGGQFEDGSDMGREEERPNPRATSTPLKATQAPVVYQNDSDLVVSQSGGDKEGQPKPKKKRLEMTAEQSGTGDVEDVGENLESPVISEELATLCSEAVVFGNDNNGNTSEVNVDIYQEVNNEVDMELDHSLMEKTRDSRISLGRDQLQGGSSRSKSLSPRKLMGDHSSYSEKRKSMLKLGLHMKVMKKTALGIHSQESMQRSRIIDSPNSVQKKRKSGKGLLEVWIRNISLKRDSGSRRLLKKGDGEIEKMLKPLRECQTCKKTVTKSRGNTCTACGEVFHKKCSSKKTEGEQWLCKMCCSRQKRPSKLTPRNKKGATGADSDQGGGKVKMNKGAAASELLMHLGRGDGENKNMEVAKKKTTLIENLAAGGNGMKTLGAIQGKGNRRPARSSAKKAVGWYSQFEEEHDSQEEPEQTRQQQFKCKDCKLGFSSSYKLRRYFSTSLHLFI